MDAVKETLKFVARIAVFLLPVVISSLTDAGNVELAAFASAALAVIDKYIHVNDDIDRNGLLPF